MLTNWPKNSGNFGLKSNGKVTLPKITFGNCGIPPEVLHNLRTEFPSEISLSFEELEIFVSRPF